MPKTPANNLLLTGRPGCGKTTVVRRVIERMSGRRLAGFYTREIREQGRRVGFEAVGLGGSQMVLAHVDFSTDKRVGPYGVEPAQDKTQLPAGHHRVGKSTSFRTR